jgi:hypothetical protein
MGGIRQKVPGLPTLLEKCEECGVCAHKLTPFWYFAWLQSFLIVVKR